MNTPSNPNHPDLHRQLRELTETTLSPAGRYAHVLLMLAAACMGVIVLALLLTEPALPLRTQAAFGTMLAVAASWVAYSAWALMHRRPLMLAHRVVAGWMAFAFTGLFTVAAFTAAAITAALAAAWAGSLGAVMWAAALGLLVHARHRQRALLARRDELRRLVAKG
jgi:hypothetical protein